VHRSYYSIGVAAGIGTPGDVHAIRDALGHLAELSLIERQSVSHLARIASAAQGGAAYGSVRVSNSPQEVLRTSSCRCNGEVLRLALHSVFERKALGSGGARVWLLLDVQATPAELVRRTGLSRATVYRVLRELTEVGMVSLAEGRYVRVVADLDAIESQHFAQLKVLAEARRRAWEDATDAFRESSAAAAREKQHIRSAVRRARLRRAGRIDRLTGEILEPKPAARHTPLDARVRASERLGGQRVRRRPAGDTRPVGLAVAHAEVEAIAL
jgi:DNA-binding transcriptional ArsR family regulator